MSDCKHQEIKTPPGYLLAVRKCSSFRARLGNIMFDDFAVINDSLKAKIQGLQSKGAGLSNDMK